MNIIKTIWEIIQQNSKKYVENVNKSYRERKESIWMRYYITQSQDYMQGRVQNFFVVLKKHQKFNPTLKAIKDKHNRILLDPKMKVSRWQGCFEVLLNGEIPATPIPVWEDQREKQQIKDIPWDEAIRAINRPKKWKASGSDGIPAELIKHGGLELHKTMYELCKRCYVPPIFNITVADLLLCA